MKLKIDDMELFAAVVEANSISRAAENLNIPKSTVSRRIKLLEECLNVRLLERTTRSLRLTDAGQEFYTGSGEILDSVKSLNHRLSQTQSSPSGRLSIFVPSELLLFVLRKHVKSFLDQYPDLELEALSGAAKPDLLHDNIDIMIHIDDPQDSSYVARKVAEAKTNFYASPEYLAQAGTPKTPADLIHHQGILDMTQDRKPRPWLVADGSTVSEIQVTPRCQTDSASTVIALAEEGLGVAMLPNFLCEQSVKEGRLVKLFDGHYEAKHNIYAIYSSRKFVPEKIRVFLQFLDEKLPDSF